MSITALGTRGGKRSNCLIEANECGCLEGQGNDVILVLEVRVTQREGNYLTKITYLEWTQCYALLAS